MPLIRFRCWKCHRKHAKSDEKVGRSFKCNCDYVIRVPKKDDGNSRIKTIGDRVIEAVLCGGGGALLGFCLAIVILSYLPIRIIGGYEAYLLVPLLTIGFGVLGFFGGERAIDLIGAIIRGHER